MFYIKDANLEDFTISDFYSREDKRYSGKILTSTARQLTVHSFDEMYPNRTLSESMSFNFDFDAGDSPDGSLLVNAIE